MADQGSVSSMTDYTPETPSNTNDLKSISVPVTALSATMDQRGLEKQTSGAYAKGMKDAEEAMQSLEAAEKAGIDQHIVKRFAKYAGSQWLMLLLGVGCAILRSVYIFLLKSLLFLTSLLLIFKQWVKLSAVKLAARTDNSIA